MNEEIFLFDTYAIIEVINGNKNYINYLDSKIIITDFIFAELCYNLIKENVPNYEDYLNKYSQFILKIDAEVIKEAMKFRHRNKKNDLSMTDCIGYIFAKKLNVKFLTGDKEFENLENVEFVK
ncbi:PIN domain-containing protein [Candidatus Woesearchaeota archaeon]|nr:PIN domain-containing protein [Candidatus Woesearchaeota archaeon]